MHSTLTFAEPALVAALDACALDGAEEIANVERLRALVGGRHHLWARSSPVHVTGSALVLHPASARVLMRWHPRLSRWMQVGGHADDGENDPWVIALREATEESGLPDLAAWPPDRVGCPIQLAIVGVPAGGDEAAHEHADLRYLLATSSPERVSSEARDAPLRWSTIDAAIAETDEANLKELLQRAKRLLQ